MKIYTSLVEMSRISIKEWCNLGDAINYKVARQEETITENMLLNIARKVPLITEIITFSKIKEGKNGADFQWTIINNRKNISYTMRFQAKKINDDLVSYRDMLRHIGGKVGNPLQIDVFLDKSKEENYAPVYVFYNFLHDLSILPRKCCCIDVDEKRLLCTPYVWGVSMSPAHKVYEKLKNKDQAVSSHIQDSLPIRCLFCPFHSCISEDRTLDPNEDNFLELVMGNVNFLSEDVEEDTATLGLMDGVPGNVKEAMDILDRYQDTPIPDDVLFDISEKFQGCRNLMITEIQ